MPTTQYARPTMELTAAQAREIAACGLTDVTVALRVYLTERSGRQFRIRWDQDPTAPFAFGATTVELAGEQPGDRAMFAELIGSCMSEVQCWVINDHPETWAAALLRAAGMPDTITNWED